MGRHFRARTLAPAPPGALLCPRARHDAGEYGGQGDHRHPAGADPVRVHRRLSHRAARFLDRAGELPRGAGSVVAGHRARRLSRPVQLLAARVRRGVRHGRGLRRDDVVRVRHQLVGVRGKDRPGDRPADGLRGADRVLPGGRLPRGDAVRHAPGRPGAAFLRHLRRRGGHVAQRVLDPLGQFLDADAGRLHPDPGRTVPAGGLVGGDLQPVVSLPPRAHGAGELPVGRLRGRRGRRLPPAARPPEPGGAGDVLDGDVDGGDRGAAAGDRRRPARTEHAPLPAGEGRGDGGGFPHRARHVAETVRPAEHEGGPHRLRPRHPPSRRADPDA